jgi:hypothetical protein
MHAPSKLRLPSPLFHHARVFLGCAGLVALAYFRTPGGGFLSDDVIIGQVTPDGARIDWGHVLRTFAGDWRGFGHVEIQYFRPLVVVSYAVDFALFGLQSWGFHLTNLLVHAVNGLLVHRLALRFGASPLAAAFAAGAFLLHPWHSEAVVWISGRADLFYATGALGALIAHLGFRQHGRHGWLGLIGLGYVLALLGKDSAIAVPLMILALDAVRPGYSRQGSVLAWAAPWLVVLPISAFYLFWRGRVLGDIFSGRRQDFSAWSKVTWDDWLTNLELFFLPFNRVQAGATPGPFYIGGFVALGLAVCAAIGCARAGRLPWRAVLACCACFVSSVALFAASMRLLWDLRGTRLLYLPTALLTIAVALCVAGASAVSKPGARTSRVTSWLSVAAAAGLIGHHLAVLAYNQRPWIESGKTIIALREMYVRTFGQYDKEMIEELPENDRGAYLALYNSTVFQPPLVRDPPRFEEQARLRMIYDSSAKVGRVVEDSAFGAAQKFERDQARGVWLWDFDGAPLGSAHLTNCSPSTVSLGFGFEATNADPWLILPVERAVAPPESADAAETAYLWIRPKPRLPPEVFWVNTERQHFGPRRLLALRPELYATPTGLAQRKVDGFYLYAARLDEHPRWPGIHRVHAVRLDPTSSEGPFTIKYFNIARELRAVR